MVSPHRLFLAISLLYFCSLTAVHCYCGKQNVHANVIEAVVQLSDWFRDHHNDISTMQPHVASLMMVSLRLAGHQPHTILSHYHDGNNLTVPQSLQASLEKTLATKSFARMAYINFGISALCVNPVVNNYDFKKAFSDAFEMFRQQDTHGFNNYFQYSVVVLAFCHNIEQVNGSVANKIVRKLSKAQRSWTKRDSATTPDTTAMIVMALSCLRAKMRQGVKKGAKLDEALSQYVRHLVDGLQSGNAWNVHSKALVLQALRAQPERQASYKLPTQVRKYQQKLMKEILEEQDDAGSFGDALTNIQVMMALTGRSLAHLGHLTCPKDIRLLQVEKPERPHQISVCIQLAFQHHNTWRYYKQLDFTLPRSTTAMELLQLAAQRSGAYQHESTNTSFGRLITAISGVKQDPQSGYYWALYADANTMTSEGVDKFVPANNTCISFRYKNFNVKNKVKSVN